MSKFAKGKSGNPSGRPVGSKDKRTALRALIEPHAPELVAKALELARAGDATSIRLLLDRCMPVLRPQAERVAFQLSADATVTDSARTVVAAIAGGELSPDVGKQLLDGLASLARIIETDELAARVAALEAKS